MKSTDLRIGNIIDLGSRIAKIIEIGHLSCVVVDLEETQDTIEDYERVKGLVLTDEWFEKWGFYKDGEYDTMRHPSNPIKEPLTKVASDILGLEYKEIKPKIYPL